MKTKKNYVRILSESAVMVALATILSLLKLVEMPYGGSVTLASALPIGLISYRHGLRAGLASAVVYGAIRQLLGLSNLSYFTTWQSIVAIILLDYILAFASIGLMGIFKGRLGLSGEALGRRQSAELSLGMLFVMIIRYICHTVSGATVWAGLSIPTSAALLYSLGYNATYMIPEAIIAVAVSGWMGDAIDFCRTVPVRMTASGAKSTAGTGLYQISLLALLLTVIVDTVLIFPHLQDAKTGVFTFAYLAEINLLALILTTLVGLAAAVLLFLVARSKAKRAAE